MKKILQLYKVYNPANMGGIPKVMESIVEVLPGYIHEFIVCYDGRNDKSAKTEKLLADSATVYRHMAPVTKASTPLSLSYFLDVLRKSKEADVVINHYPYPMTDLSLLFSKKRYRYIVWWHCEPEKAKWLEMLYKPLIMHSLRKADVIVASSQGLIEHSAYLQHFRDKCTVVPFSVADDYLEEGAEYLRNKENANEQVNEDKEIRILYIGRLVWYKGCDVLLRAFSKMQTPNCRLIMIGDGPLKAELQAQANTTGINVEFVGFVSEEEKKRYIRECDFLVLPSISKAEAFAIVQIEAMAFGKPVINTNLPSGVPYVSIHGTTGLTVEPKDEMTLTEAMDKLARDKGLRESYGQNARKRLEENYTKAVMKEKLRLVLKD